MRRNFGLLISRVLTSFCSEAWVRGFGLLLLMMLGVRARGDRRERLKCATDWLAVSLPTLVVELITIFGTRSFPSAIFDFLAGDSCGLMSSWSRMLVIPLIRLSSSLSSLRSAATYG